MKEKRTDLKIRMIECGISQKAMVLLLQHKGIYCQQPEVSMAIAGKLEPKLNKIREGVIEILNEKEE